MLKSMTAYGRACIDFPIGRFIAEIQSVNRKHLEISALLPKEFTRFDLEIKKWISAVIGRGQISVKIAATFDTISPQMVTPNLPLVRQLKKAWDEILKELNLDPKLSFSIDVIAQEPGILNFGEDLYEEELYRKALREVIAKALEQLVTMKKKEGELLYTDIAARIEWLKKWIKSIEEKAPNATVKYRQKLIERLEEVLAGSVENEEKILREVSIYAERIDITEEITRFEVHLAHLLELLNIEEQTVGKTMDFLLQELNREANTIGSKSSDVEISRLVINIKSELEKIREQIQNIE